MASSDTQPEVVCEALKEVSLNEGPSTNCAFCSKEKATKRCSKRHAKCLKKLFCDKICETSGHRVKKPDPPPSEEAENAEEPSQENAEALAKRQEQEKVMKAKKKKAKKAANAAKKGSDGQFWWNNSVFASW